MKDLTFSGNMPFKIEGPLNLQDGFRRLTGQMLQIMFQILKNEKPDEYPYSNYSLRGSDGEIEEGIQLVIEADCFGTDFLMLRMHQDGYTLAMTSEDENIGTMEYQFLDDDDLVELIPQHVRTHMEKHRYGFDQD
jgi:hypothetical protein